MVGPRDLKTGDDGVAKNSTYPNLTFIKMSRQAGANLISSRFPIAS